VVFSNHTEANTEFDLSVQSTLLTRHTMCHALRGRMNATSRNESKALMSLKNEDETGINAEP